MQEPFMYIYLEFRGSPSNSLGGTSCEKCDWAHFFNLIEFLAHQPVFMGPNNMYKFSETIIGYGVPKYRAKLWFMEILDRKNCSYGEHVTSALVQSLRRRSSSNQLIWAFDWIVPTSLLMRCWSLLWCQWRCWCLLWCRWHSLLWLVTSIWIAPHRHRHCSGGALIASCPYGV